MASKPTSCAPRSGVPARRSRSSSIARCARFGPPPGSRSMWPDRSDGFDPELDGEPELADLSAELEAAGLRARRSAADRGAERPDRAFATALRSRLLAQLPAAGSRAATAAAATPA